MDRREAARARSRLHGAVRAFLAGRGFEEVETPVLVPAPGMEPHIDAFATRFAPEGGGGGAPLWLRTSPEYAMKRLLAAGFERIFELGRVFRNGELTPAHNPEFTLLEFYRAGADYRAIQEDVEELAAAAARALRGGMLVPWRGGTLDFTPPFERLSVAEAFRRHAGIEVGACEGDAERLRAAARAAGLEAGAPGDGFDDLFFRIFLERIEPRIGLARPVFVVDWPAPMAALARLRADDPRWAERFELYAGGLELANGFSELTDAGEQRRRLEEEQAQRRRLGRPVYPVSEPFLADLARMPPAGGVAVGIDRLLMLLAGAERIQEVLLFPGAEFL